MRLRVLATRPGGGVSIIIPSARCVGVLRRGGMRLARAWEVHKLVCDPQWRPDRSDRQDFAQRWVDALMRGGYGEREAVALIGEYSAPPFATALETVDVSAIPTDRTHRDAWRRSPNGGPIWVDEEKAQAIDEARMWRAFEGKRA